MKLGVINSAISLYYDLGAVAHVSGLTGPGGISPDTTGLVSWNVHEWPTVYVVDAAGVIRFKGAAHEKVLDEAVGRLLGETNGAK